MPQIPHTSRTVNESEPHPPMAAEVLTENDRVAIPAPPGAGVCKVEPANPVGPLKHSVSASMEGPSPTGFGGIPAAKGPGGTSLDTTEPAPIIASSPTVTPGRTVTPAGTHTLSPKVTSSSFRGFPSKYDSQTPCVKIMLPGPTPVSRPNLTLAEQSIQARGPT